MTERVWAIVALMAVTLTTGPRSGAAETYRWVDAHGTVTYSDEAPQSGVPTVPAPTIERESPREVSVVASPPGPPRKGPATVDELLALAGAEAELAGFASRLAAEFRPGKGPMSPEDRAVIERVLSRELRPKAIYALVRDELRGHVDRPKLDAAVAWLETPLGRKITALETAMSELGADPKIAEYAKSLQATPPPAARVELLERLEWVSGSDDASVEITASIARSSAKAMAAVLPPERRLRPGQIERQVAEVKARVDDAVRRQAMVSRLYTYRSLGDLELEQYVRFSSSDAGRWCNAAMQKALLRTFDNVLERAAVELLKAVPPERWAAASAPPVAK